MRKLVWIALLAACAAAFFLYTSGAALAQLPQAGQGNNTRTASFGLYSSELADSGNGSAAVLHLFLYPASNGSVVVRCSAAPLQGSVLLLQHPAAPGINATLRKAIEQKLAACGLSSRQANASAAIAARDAVIIAPSGAVPAALAGNSSAIGAQNSRVIVVSELSGRMIDAKGAISQMNGSAGFVIVELAPGGEGKAAEQAVMAALDVPGAEGATYPGWSGERTLAVPMNASEAYCRAVYLESDACRFADSGKLEKPKGILFGPSSALAGQGQEFEFSPEEGSEVGRKLEFEAIVLAGRKEEARRGIAGGEIRGGWANVFSLNFTGAGPHIVRVEDQFGRLHAQAYVNVLGLEVKPVSHDGNRYEFEALFGGKPVDGMVEARLDGGEPRQFYSSGGKLVVWASPPAGKREMEFSYQGLVSSYGFVAEGGGLADSYIRYGIPALVFLAAVYLLVRVGRKAKYSITFPEAAGQAPTLVPTTSEEVREAWRMADASLGSHGLVAYPEEIAAKLAQSKGVRIDPHGFQRVLLQLVSSGKFAESEGAYIPGSSMGGFSAAELRAMRLLHDIMLEQGMPFARKRLQNASGTDVEMLLFPGKAGVLHGIGKHRRVVLFVGREALEEFEQELSGPGSENTRIKLAMDNGKVALVTASRKELESALL